MLRVLAYDDVNRVGAIAQAEVRISYCNENALERMQSNFAELAVCHFKDGASDIDGNTSNTE